MGRTLAKLVQLPLGQPVSVTNIAGAAGNEGLAKLGQRPADGYTMATLSGLSVASWAAGLGGAKIDDFEIVAWAQNTPSMLFVPKQSPYVAIQDLLGFAKLNPRAIKVATSGFGTGDDVTLRLLARMGYPMTNVPFANPLERYHAAVSGETEAIYEEPGDVARYLLKRDLRPLVVFDDVRHYGFLKVPTAPEVGVDITNLHNFRALVVRAGTPRDRIRTLTAAFDYVLDSPEWGVFCVRTFTCIRKAHPDEAKQAAHEFHRAVRKVLDTVPR